MPAPDPTSLPPSRPGLRRADGPLRCVWPCACLAAALALAACGRPPARAHQLRVVSTFGILGDLVAQVSGDRVAQAVLVGPDGDAHEFAPTPRDAEALARADVIFEIGLGFESWLDKLYQASGSKARRVVVTEGITPRTLVEHGRTETDPHVWHDVHHAARAVERIAAALEEAQPASADAFHANAQAYTKQLNDLDAWVVRQVATLRPERRKLVTSHDSLGYFGARYGFAVIGAGLESVTTETTDPSAAHLAELIRAVRQAGVPAIFAENMQNPRLMEQIAREAGVKLAPPLYTDAFGPAGSPAATYCDLVRYNVQTIVEALKP